MTPSFDSERLLSALIFCACFCLYAFTASGFGYWFDAGEFIAASATLGVPHPPGTPLAVLIGNAVSCIPLGSIAFRVALASGLMGAWAGLFYFRSLMLTSKHLTGQAEPILCVIGTLALVMSHGFWFQCVRPEVYALNAALSAWILFEVISFATKEQKDPRRLYRAMFALGAGIANHHLLILLMGIVMAPVLLQALRMHRLTFFSYCAAAVCLGATTYLYLPLRASRHPFMNMGDPHTWERFFWVVSAKAFQKNTGGDVPQPFSERGMDVLIQLITNHGLWALLVAFIGAYTLLRRKAFLLGWIWITLAIVPTCVRIWLGFVRSNPDALGYLMGSFMGIVGLASCAGMTLLSLKPGLNGLKRSSLATAFACLIFVQWVPAVTEPTFRGNALKNFSALDAFADARYRNAPMQSNILVYNPETVFTLWGIESEEEVRPDLSMIAMPFLSYPKDQAVSGTQHPIFDESISLTTLREMNALRPLLIELDPRMPDDFHFQLEPKEIFYQLASSHHATTASAVKHRALYRQIQSDLADSETRAQLLWIHYMDAIHYARIGERDTALRAIAMAHAIQPLARELAALKVALEQSSEGAPLEVKEFEP